MRRKTSLKGGKVLKIILFGFSFFCFDFDNFTFRVWVVGFFDFFVVLCFICSFLGGVFLFVGFRLFGFWGFFVLFWGFYLFVVFVWFCFGFNRDVNAYEYLYALKAPH